jgi:hypothetical protein
LNGASVGAVPKPAEQGGDAIRIVEDLNVLGSQFEIMVLDDASSSLFESSVRIISNLSRENHMHSGRSQGRNVDSSSGRFKRK